MPPNRSPRGCLTCKRRKKKCDEKQPHCDRCLLSDFDCLGYAHLIKERPGTSSNKSTGLDAQFVSACAPNIQRSTRQSSVHTGGLPGDVCLPIIHCLGGQMQPTALSLAHFPKRPLNIPTSPPLDQLERDTMVDLIVSQYLRVADRIPFRPFPYPMAKLMTTRARSSNTILTSMYIGARIVRALLDQTNWHAYVGWIETFHRQISRSQSNVTEADMAQLADRLSAIYDLSLLVFTLFSSLSGYSLLRQGAPIFLQLAAKYPQVWTQDSTISISHALNSSRHEMARFVLADTISALAFGTAPLLNYDTTIHKDELENGTNAFLEQIYSCPMIILIQLAKINSNRTARLVNQGSPNSRDIQEVESCIRNWNPVIDYTDKPSESVARLAIQECWRQAALVYAYMGMCEVNSADERVQRLVSQVAQLASTIEAGNPLETHLSVPCLIAGAAARKEKHRAIFRKKILVSQNIDARLLRGADFVHVLDHLWHGVAVGGSPVTWEDYVNSRYANMPVDI